MRSLLKSLGCEVTIVHSGEAALAAVQSGEAFDAITLDWHMPGMNGAETARGLRSRGFAGRILLITARDVGSEPIELADFDARLAKPVALASLRDTLEAVLAGGDADGYDAGSGSEPALPSLEGARVLLVDDNEFNRQIGQELLELVDIEVRLACDGAEAVELARCDAFDLILMDLQMPVMDGYEAAARIRKDHPALPIIALTAHAMKSEKTRVLAAGMNDLLTKPIDQAGFYKALCRWLRPFVKARPLPGPAPLADAAGTVAPVAPEALDSQNAQPTRAPAGVAASDRAAEQGDTDMFDREAALGRVGGDARMLERFLGLFWTRNGPVRDELGTALASGDVEGARRRAHALKGGAGTVGLVELQGIARRIEVLLDEPGLPGVPAEACTEYELLKSAWQRAESALRQTSEENA
ncbi:MAG: response regulator [Rhodocyclaceae bacterium]|nr:response regulator [Rhodocyclaceae bacterium]